MMNGTSLRATLSRAYRTARCTVGGCAVVMTYHRVIDLPSDPESLAIPPAVFEEQIRVLAATYNMMTARELCELLQARRRIPRRTVVVTFDDGYFDLLEFARPILERHAVPATAFLSTADIGGSRERWWDEIAYLCLEGLSLPDRIAFAAAGRTFEHDRCGTAEEPRALYSALRAHLWPLDARSREDSLDALFATAGYERPQRAEYRSLDAEEVRELASSGLIEIGAHTVSHQMLSAVSAEVQAAEITQSKAALEDILGRTVPVFSYPYGGREHIGPDTRGIVAQAGFSCAFANWFGLAFPWTGRFAIPRCPASTLPGPEFAARLEHWFSLGR